MNEIIIEGMVLDFYGNPGTICFKTIKDGNLYVNVSFGEIEDYENMVFKVFLVKDLGTNVDFIEVEDKELLGDLTSAWVADTVKESQQE